MRSGRGGHCNCCTHSERSGCRAGCGNWRKVVRSWQGARRPARRARGQSGQSASQSEPSCWVFLGLASRRLPVLARKMNRSARAARQEWKRSWTWQTRVSTRFVSCCRTRWSNGRLAIQNREAGESRVGSSAQQGRPRCLVGGSTRRLGLL